MSLIYKATFPNGKVYIGQTTQTLENRKYQHRRDAIDLNRKSPFFFAIRKYGWENIKWEVVEEGEFTVEELDDKEIYYISFYHSCVKDENCNGYNVLKGRHNDDSLRIRLKDMKPILDKIVQMNKDGIEEKEIAKEVNLDVDTVKRILKGRTWQYYTGISRVPPQINYLSLSEIEEILLMHKNGKSFQEIADKIGRNKTTIWEVLNGDTYQEITKIPVSEKSERETFTLEDISQIMQMYNDGFPCKRIAEKFGYNIKNVWNIVSGVTHSKETGVQKARKTKGLLSHEWIDYILKLHSEGNNATTISKIVDSNVTIIDRILKGLSYSDYTGIKPVRMSEVRREKDEKIIDQVFALYKEGKSNKEISQILNISETKTSRILKGKIYTNYIISHYKDEMKK